MSKPLIAIRSAQPEDLTGLRDVAYRTWRATYEGMMPDSDIDAFLEHNYALDTLTRRLERTGIDHGHILLVAICDGAVIGYASAGINQDGDAELFTVYVLPRLHGRGAGWQLWREAATFLAALGYDEFVVWVLDSNDRMRRFCERQGAVKESERPFLVGEQTITEVGYRAHTS